MRVAIDPWDPSYGAAVEGAGFDETSTEVRLDAELAPGRWRPLRPPPDQTQPRAMVFVDGVRRIDARVWVAPDARPDDRDAPVAAGPGLCASWAAGAVSCIAGSARVGAVEVGHGLFSAVVELEDLVTRHAVFAARTARDASPEGLSLALQEQMGRAEVRVAAAAVEALGALAGSVDPGGPLGPPLVVVDGPLRGRQHLASTIGLIKSHHVQYLGGAEATVLAALAPGERTPLLLVGQRFVRWSWYVRLPGVLPSSALSPLAGVVRCEASTELTVGEAVAVANAVTAALPRYASAPHRDSRAPQNLYPIGGLERILRRRLGDAPLLYRALRVAASQAAVGPSAGAVVAG